MQISDEQRAFLQDHRLCVFGYRRKDGPPSLTPVYYVLDGDDLVISTTASRGKAKAVARDPEVSVCVLEEQMPFSYLTVFGRARIEEDGAADVMRRIGEVMTGNAVPDAALPALEERAKNEGRVVLRVTPERLVSTRALGRSSQ